jgi:hypothetical protein
VQNPRAEQRIIGKRLNVRQEDDNLFDWRGDFKPRMQGYRVRSPAEEDSEDKRLLAFLLMKNYPEVD